MGHHDPHILDIDNHLDYTLLFGLSPSCLGNRGTWLFDKYDIVTVNSQARMLKISLAEIPTARVSESFVHVI